MKDGRARRPITGARERKRRRRRREEGRRMKV